LINYFKSYSSLGDDHFLVSPLYLLLSAGLTIGVSTATCEAGFSSVVRILTPYRKCITPP